MLRLIGGTIASVVTWAVAVTLLNLGLRHGWPAYAAVEKAMTFTLPMMAARLAMSGVSSTAGGVVAGGVDRSGRAPLAGGIVLLLGFLPLHISIWGRFPVWYHLTFLASLPVIPWIVGWSRRSRGRVAG